MNLLPGGKNLSTRYKFTILLCLEDVCQLDLKHAQIIEAHKNS